MLKIIPLGGLGEIGLNMMVFEYGDTIFVVDAGLMFPEDYMLGVDIVIPDMSYLRQRKERVSGFVFTHAHEDHIGALPYLLKEINAPVFATPFTLGVSMGASLGAAMYVRFGIPFTIIILSGTSLSAFVGAAGSIMLVYGVTRAKGGLSTTTMLLAGVATSFCLFQSPPLYP